MCTDILIIQNEKFFDLLQRVYDVIGLEPQYSTALGQYSPKPLSLANEVLCHLKPQCSQFF